MTYLTGREYAALHDVDIATVRWWHRTGRLPSAHRAIVGSRAQLQIPAGCPRPTPGTPGRKPSKPPPARRARRKAAR